MFTWQLVLLSIVQAGVLFAATCYWRRKVAVWIAAMPALYVIMNHASWLTEDPFNVGLLGNLSI